METKRGKIQKKRKPNKMLDFLFFSCCKALDSVKDELDKVLYVVLVFSVGTMCAAVGDNHAACHCLMAHQA